MLKMKDLILKWADERGLLVQGNERNQLIKLMEEVGELSSAILKDKPSEVKDALGDIQVVLIILSNQLGYDLDECLQDAYNVIKNRTGKKVNGIFVKDE